MRCTNLYHLYNLKSVNPTQHSSMGVFHVYKIVQMVPNHAKHLIWNRYSYWVTQIHIFFTFMSKLGFHELSCSNLNCDRKKPLVNWLNAKPPHPDDFFHFLFSANWKLTWCKVHLLNLSIAFACFFPRYFLILLVKFFW